MPPKELSFLTRVRESLSTLNPAERRLGEFVCDFPAELASYSASELATLAQVSNATVSRFVKRLGYENYEAARRHARVEKQSGSRLFLTGSVDSASVQSVEAHVAQGVANIESTFLGISEGQISAVAQSMLDARKVWVLGFRSSYPFASYLQWQMTQVVENIVALPGAGQTLGESLVSMTEQDMVVVFGLRRRVANMDAILELIKKNGAKLLYITDEGVAPLSSVTWHFRCQTLAPGPLFNHVAVMGVCHLLATRAIELAGSAGRARLRGIESFNDSLDEL
ncbi:MurR/RpiR family transcriptional regulator [Pseudomonas extremaustralis]|jgi:DNA-binding MurR/RpiR family transcriptional regulator|uniref:MurR/RpiR family transcriptional regulator n=1 Tax=Pseudomonas extremaustralis TaxID=359110 RepID=A0A5C5Q6S1_9PSED|nr:MurR/RpiR family transcriptional regulator [Pseudomonas extremaustralis]EZI24837.1 DNA-binding protein [Pseudomonas extremaustralis 14-3 substr. 14-3b]MDB1111686.1 MurR/RpiR family transcriptional regulator [Pseudomonas extremaustralis]MDF3134034.1 MurR/RpiR family transcriptional regulator [Pseudomonas extremaustralis]MDG2966930.1 MurR/RpiR family transcriptional regulator [Pseudomonas extremaustralis]TWS00910.1 MurR/RpiR family transcriptional regulator [Pseudomonas extremaustralis]